jgi:hypothetical protein
MKAGRRARELVEAGRAVNGALNVLESDERADEAILGIAEAIVAAN